MLVLKIQYVVLKNVLWKYVPVFVFLLCATANGSDSAFSVFQFFTLLFDLGG